MLGIVVLLEYPIPPKGLICITEKVFCQYFAIELPIHVFSEHVKANCALSTECPPDMNFERMLDSSTLGSLFSQLVTCEGGIPEELEGGFIGENRFVPRLTQVLPCPFNTPSFLSNRKKGYWQWYTDTVTEVEKVFTDCPWAEKVFCQYFAMELPIHVFSEHVKANCALSTECPPDMNSERMLDSSKLGSLFSQLVTCEGGIPEELDGGFIGEKPFCST